MEPTPDTANKWLDLADRYGLPLVFLFVVMCFVVAIVWGLWRALKPHFDRFAEKHMVLMDTATSCLSTLSNSVGELKDNHVEILQKLDGVAVAIKDSDKQCRDATAEARKESRDDIKAFFADSRNERREDRAEHSTHWLDVRKALHRIGDVMRGKPTQEGDSQI